MICSRFCVYIEFSMAAPHPFSLKVSYETRNSLIDGTFDSRLWVDRREQQQFHRIGERRIQQHYDSGEPKPSQFRQYDRRDTR